MNKIIFFIIYILLIALAEIVTSFVNPIYGFLFHVTILISLLVLSALKYMDNPLSNLFLSLSLAPLIRIISLCLPLAYFPYYSWYFLTGSLVFLATLALMRILNLKFSDIGVKFNKPLVQLVIGFSGVPLGIIEFHILKPEPLISELNLLNLIFLALGFIFFTGFVEELVFRGIIQRSVITCLNWKIGILIVSLIFAILHIGWLSLFDFIFVFLVGLIFGYIVFKTGSIIGVSLSHGLTNVLLFLILPS